MIERVTTALIDPQFQVGTISLDGGACHVMFLSFSHPIHGEVTALVPTASAEQLVDLIQKTQASIEQKKVTSQ